MVAFRYNFDRNNFSHISFDFSSRNDWIWWPHTSKTTHVTAVYDYLNTSNNDHYVWNGWRHLWKLKVAPCVKTFLWKVAYGKLPIGAYLYRLNIGPTSICHFCGLHPKSTDHILWNCQSTLGCWHTIFNWLGLNPSFLNQLALRNWLTNSINCWATSEFKRAVIATMAWLIWFARCLLIFQYTNPNFSRIPMKAWTDTTDFFTANHHCK